MPEAQTPGFMGFLPLIIIFVIFYFLIIMPQRKQQKKHKDMVQSLQKNDEIVTVGGLHGIIVNIKEKTFVVRVDDNTRIEVDKSAVSYKVSK